MDNNSQLNDQVCARDSPEARDGCMLDGNVLNEDVEDVVRTSSVEYEYNNKDKLISGKREDCNNEEQLKYNEGTLPLYESIDCLNDDARSEDHQFNYEDYLADNEESDDTLPSDEDVNCLSDDSNCDDTLTSNEDIEYLSGDSSCDDTLTSYEDIDCLSDDTLTDDGDKDDITFHDSGSMDTHDSDAGDSEYGDFVDEFINQHDYIPLEGRNFWNRSRDDLLHIVQDDDDCRYDDFIEMEAPIREEFDADILNRIRNFIDSESCDSGFHESLD